MKTDDLIDALARNEGKSSQPGPTQRLLSASMIGLLGGFVLLMVTLGLRDDFGVSAAIVLLKACFSAVFAVVGAAALMRLVRPGAATGPRLAAALLVLSAAIAVGALALVGEAPGQRLQALTAGVFPWCVLLIPLFGAPTAAALAYVVRSLAPTRLTVTGAAIGAAAGGVGAVIYAMHCPIDSVPFVTIWYSAGIAVSGVLGAVLGSRLLRW